MRVAVCLLVVFASLQIALGQQCRMDPGSRHGYCGLPVKLANFQGYYECDNKVKIGRPTTIDDAQRLVTMFSKAKPVGVGHSWWKEQFCAGNDTTSINLVMTEIKTVLDFIQRPVKPSEFRNKPVPENFPIKVDEDKQTVTVAAGIPQRQLLAYLAEYRYWKQPDGWTIPAFSWFIDQTIGGAVATGTHGSSLRWGSLSSQVRGMKVILANGTLFELQSPDQDPHLWKALGVSVGRLGVITELTMRIKPQQAVRRKLQDLDFPAFAQQVKRVQDEYNAAKASGDQDAMRRALFPLHETQALWHVATSNVWRTDFEYLDKEPLSVLLNIEQSDPMVQAMNGPDQGVYNQGKRNPVPPNNRMTLNPRYWANFYGTTMRGFVTPGTYESSKSYLSMSEFGNQASSTFAPYDQYETAVPMERAGDCLMELGNEIYGPSNLWEGFRTPALVRFVSGEEFYLSPSNGGPVMYVNIEDYLSKTTKKPNNKFDKVMDIFTKRCGGRMHWGKAGWATLDAGKCFDGASAEYGYPKTWCHFGCATHQLDPNGKFSSESNVWRWKASRAGQTVDFGSCCTPEGFSSECTCEPSPVC